jgi:Cu+-exporting ATPase
MTGDVSFDEVQDEATLAKAQKRVEDLGYKVRPASARPEPLPEKRKISKYLLRFWISLPFTIVLMLHMIPALHQHWLMNPWVQFGLALPVYLIGMEFFGRSAWNSIRSGIPNMNVLIALGSSAAFLYSTYGLFTHEPENFLFFETAASIITIVFFGNWLEDISVARTQREINKLSRQQVVMANMIAYDADKHEHIFPVESTSLQVGDLIMLRTGEQVPADAKLLSGDAQVSEALLTGESIPRSKKQGDPLIGGSLVVNGNARAMVTATGEKTVMSQIVAMMKKAQTEKPPVQQLADKISAIFIPIVLGIALLTLLGNLFITDHNFQESLMRSVAVLVIACPCAMGLATPAAIAVGLGRAAKNGILYTDVSRMELFRNVKQMVFDKTGTLTTGQFVVTDFETSLESEDMFKRIVSSIEKFSNHPIAKSLVKEWMTGTAMRFEKVEEIKGRGMVAIDREGNEWQLGSSKMLSQVPEQQHQLYLLKNKEMAGWVDISDALRPEAKAVIAYCRSKGIKTILLSGDTAAKCARVADELQLDEIYAGKSPAEKLEVIEALMKEAPTVMVGDGINDAPALAKATISVSLGEASQLAIQSASVVLTGGGLSQLPKAMQLGKLTYGTVKSNLFWAFFYNVIAIPVAALGYLHPSIGALIMGGSDVVLALNSLFLGVRKLDEGAA